MERIGHVLKKTGTRTDARTLERHGGVHEVVPDADLLSVAVALAADIAKNSPSAVQLMKEAINMTEDMPLNEG